MATDKERKHVLANILEKLGAAWPKKVLSNEEVALWYEQIGHLDKATALKACSMVISECEWYPTIAKYLECARSIMRAQEASLATAPVLLTDAARKIQQQALAVQREVATRRSMLLGADGPEPEVAKGHNHADGWMSCSVCVQAGIENNKADECSTCMLLEINGMHASHHHR